MLDDYCKSQPIAYKILKHELCNNKLSHVYLFSSDNIDVPNQFAFSCAKTFFCPQNYTNTDKCENCSVCHRIDNKNFPELKIIVPDGLWIKKEQLVFLQDQLRTKALEGSKRIYIVESIEKLNLQAANSMLKFLEEPEPGIIALLTTSDIHNVLPTILSRCQIVNLKSINDLTSAGNGFNTNNTTLVKIAKLYCHSDNLAAEFIKDAKNVDKINAIVSFAKKYEAIKMDILLEIKKLWYDYFVEKEDYIFAFDLLVFLYKDVLNQLCGRSIEIFDYYHETVEYIANLNTVNSVIYKLNKVLLLKEEIKYNINLNLLMDKLIIEMESGDYSC